MDAKKHFLVTAGSTREKIDDVRAWSNIFTGRTGLDIALALLDLGDVTLLTSNTAHAAQYDGYYGKHGMLGIETFITHTDLRNLLEERMSAGGVHGVFMSAAVSDYTPAGVYRVIKRETQTNGQEHWLVENVQAQKVKSSHGTIAILGQATEKLVDLFRTRWNYRGLLVKFKLEVGISEEDLIKIAGESRRSSGADYIVANTLAMVSGENAGAYVIGEGTCIRVQRADLAARLKTIAAR
jgi:phosphopantothenoylcysteine synthetase/decarboxylase